jgi:hypothetical protein
LLNPVIISPEAIIAVMREDSRRHLYTAEDGSLWISDQGGMVAGEDAVRRLVDAGVLKLQWPDVEGCWILAN